MPYKNSKEYITNESFQQFWTEQYLLQSFLSFNSEFEILLAMAFIMGDYSEVFQKSFPHSKQKDHNLISGSFWIKRKNRNKNIVNDMNKNEIYPLVTVITPTYNRAAYIDETITSVLTQDYPNIEYIVIDDGSTDNTLSVIKKYNKQIRLKTHSNIGETRTVNNGFSIANGEIIVVVNSDDPLLPGAISTAVEYLKNNPEALVAYPDWNEIGPKSELKRRVKLPDYNIYNMLKTLNIGLGPGNFIRKKTFEIIGMRDTQFRYVGDLEFWLRTALHGQLIHIPETLATHRTHEDAASYTDKGSVMADELVQMIHKIYAHPQLSEKIKSMRFNVLGRMHYKAAKNYSGASTKAKFKHYFASICYSPGYAIPMLVFSILKCIRSSLRSIK